MPRWVTAVLAALVAAGPLALAAPATAEDARIRVLFVGGDWKAQLPNYRGDTPLRGHFVRREVEKAAPGRFDFTLWTSYEFLQYGDAASLGAFDVVVVGDVMGQSVMPRLVEGLGRFVRDGGGLMYCDNHKAFMFYTKERSFDAVLPIEVVPFRAYAPPEENQPLVKGPVRVQVAARDHPIANGLDWAGAPALRGARHGKPKPGATVVARGPGGEPIWVAGDVGKGRTFWAGGVLANDELSEDFAGWADFGRFYAQALAWLAEKSAAPRGNLQDAIATATLTVDLAKKGPPLTSKHFGIHGQEASGPGEGMQGEDLALYRALNLDDTFARIGAAADAPRRVQGGQQWEYLDRSTDLETFDGSLYDFTRLDAVLADCRRIRAVPLCLYWCPWKFEGVDMRPERWTKYFAAALEHANGRPGSPAYANRITYFEIMNEPDLSPAPQKVDEYARFFNYAAERLAKRYPGVTCGYGGFYEWPYLVDVMDRCAKNVGWISRHPYGHTGEAVFDLGDRYIEHARGLGLKDLAYIITEWDFWIYGRPAFDYIMQRWKPLADHADTCLGTLHYRWREYHEGGYVFGLHGEFDQRYGELPPEWPNPGKNKPITYRYNAFWLMRDARGTQSAATVASPELATSPSPRVYAIATSREGRFNVVAYYGYPYVDLASGKSYGSIRLKVRCPLPPEVKGRRLVVSRADCKTIREEPERTIEGDAMDLELDLPATSGVSLTVK